ncbi:MAG: hypothetical protein ACK5JG_13995, partial [Pseudomonadota bacterium]
MMPAILRSRSAVHSMRSGVPAARSRNVPGVVVDSQLPAGLEARQASVADQSAGMPSRSTAITAMAGGGVLVQPPIVQATSAAWAQAGPGRGQRPQRGGCASARSRSRTGMRLGITVKAQTS